MKLLAVCTGRAERLPGKSYRTGIGKTPVTAPVLLDALGLVGDAVCNTKHHGGEDQAILLEGSHTLDWWSARLGREITPGAFGENLVVEGLDNREVAAGDRFRIGDVVLEATMPRIPCNTLAAKMNDPAFAKAYFQAARPGVYCRVIAPGVLAPGAPVMSGPYQGERVTMPELMAAYVERPADAARYLAAPIGIRLRARLQR